LQQHIATPPAAWADASTIASIVYTSGTTGIPKGVMLTHANFVSNARAALEAIPITEHDIFVSFLPLSHVFERAAGYYVPLVCAGACIAYAENPKVLQENLREVRPTVLIAVPRLFEKLHDTIWAKVNASGALKRKLFIAALKSQANTWQHRVFDHLVFKKIQKRLGGRLRVVVSGGASLNPKLGKFFERLGIRIVEGYGMTEASPIIAANRVDDYAFGTVGRAVTGVEVKIGENKEILARGPNIMAGYHNHPEITGQMIDSDGWLHTGDQGFIDAHGRITIIGRTKEMLVTAGGKNVWPEPIEFALNDDRMVAQSMVVGDGQKFIGALIVPFWPAVLEFAAQHQLPPDPNVLRTHPKVIEEFSHRVERINMHLAEWEQIRNFTLLLEEFTQDRDELTPTLKLRRRAVHHHHKAAIDQLYQK
jgi:long-chain acyl-CoA synthetase